MDLTEPVLLTRQGLDKLALELEQVRLRRADVAEQMKEAVQPGDIEDNPEYEQSKTEVSRADVRIYELEEMIGRAQIIEEGHGEIATPGSIIKVRAADGAEETYHLVGAVEADPQSGRISVESPVGRALVGKRHGDKVVVDAPSGQFRLTVISVA
ncbi:MAG TPA: GreA/GreB family elongation factor [Candidatus Acidoferrales bacterium]|nr:GreA/GreB family elongation factor [Candidatus Acidoferrales bacterium]